ncbi:hypothetical protein [Vulcanisaeta sp. JCM 16159]|nr:hypothetical protein [Vulcanisaeta sp. JCM 16159]
MEGWAERRAEYCHFDCRDNGCECIFMVFSMVQFGNEVSQSSIEYVASF